MYSVISSIQKGICIVFHLACNFVYQRVSNILFSVNNILHNWPILDVIRIAYLIKYDHY